MAEELDRARTAIQRASDRSDNATVREQLESIDEGLMEMTTDAGEEPGARTAGDRPHADRLTELEEKIVGLADRTDGTTRDHLEVARDHLDAYRRRHAPDW